MKNGICSIVVAMSLLTSSFTFACDIDGKTGFLPDNDMYISESDKASNNMTQERFNQIITRVEKAYAPIVASKGANFSVIKNWTDGTVNAYASQNGKTWTVSMFGGLARHPLVTDDGFMLVVCHETGHHLGGAPKKNVLGGRWASNEGQSDYFGSMKCMRRVLENDDNIAIVSKMLVDPFVAIKCKSAYTNENEIALCKRIAMAGKSLALLLAELGKSKKISFTTPSKTVVTKTNDNHPDAQCRMDTYLSGTLCDMSYDQDVDDKDPTVGVCLQRDGHKQGTRPLCWYKPTAQEI